MANRSAPMFEQVEGQPVSRRDELLAIAAGLMADFGFAGVTVDDIGAAAGISGPALYHHFDSKEAMLGEMLVRISESLLAKGKAIEAAQGLAEGEDRLLALIEMHVDFAVDNQSLITVHFRDLVHTSNGDRRRVRDLQNAYVDIWVRVLAGTDTEWAASKAARAAVHAVLGLINSTPHSGRARRDDMVPLLRSMSAAALAAARSVPH